MQTQTSQLRATFQSIAVLPTLEIKHLDEVPPLLDLLAAAAYPALEILHRNPLTWSALALIRSRAPELKVGVGTLCCADDLQRARDGGASFAVSPGLLPALVSAARKMNVAYLPGLSTASEAMQLLGKAGDLAKFFPAGALGPLYLKQLSAAFPGLNWVVSGGISSENWQNFAMLPQVICVSGSWMLPAQSRVSESTRQHRIEELVQLRAEAQSLIRN